MSGGGDREFSAFCLNVLVGLSDLGGRRGGENIVPWDGVSTYLVGRVSHRQLMSIGGFGTKRNVNKFLIVS